MEKQEPNVGFVKKLEEIKKLVSLIDKVSMVCKNKLITNCMLKEGWDNPDNYNDWIEKAKRAIDDKQWEDAINFLSFCWFLDWSNYLNRDFLKDGGEPEHQTTS